MKRRRARPSPARRAASGGRHGQGRCRQERRHGRARARRRRRRPTRARRRGGARTARRAARRAARSRAAGARAAAGGGRGGARDCARRLRAERAAAAHARPSAAREHELPGPGGRGAGAVRVPRPPSALGLARCAPRRPVRVRPRPRRRARVGTLVAAARRADGARCARALRAGGREPANHRPAARRSHGHARLPGDDARGAGGPRDDRPPPRARRAPAAAARAADRQRAARPSLRRRGQRRARPARGERADASLPCGGALRAAAPPGGGGAGGRAPPRDRGSGAPALPLRRPRGRRRPRPPERGARGGRRPRRMTLERALGEARILLCVGSGGVGKTTTAAALGVAAARRGRTTAVLTVDPAQRLKDALGLDALDGAPRRVALAAGAPLDAMLLDVKRTFDVLVAGLAATPEQARRVLENRLYQNLSSTLAGTAEYMAVETVYRLAEEERYELVVVDTPPSRHAVDFLDAPRRLLALLDSRAFAILKDPTSILPAAGSRLAHLLLLGVLRGLERFTGLGLVREIGEFVQAIEALTEAFRARVQAVAALLRSRGTMIVLVTTPEPRLTAETEALARALGGIGLPIGGVIVNRALPRAVFGAQPPGPPPGTPPALAARLARAFADLQALAARQASVVAPLLAGAGAPLLAEVPLLATAPASLAELADLARHLVPDVDPPARATRGSA